MGPGGGKPVSKKATSDTPNSSHMPYKPPHDSQTTTQDNANAWEALWIHAILLKPATICTGFSVLCIDKKKSRPSHLLLLFYH